MKPSEILKKGLELLETKGWAQEELARNADGDPTQDAEEAVCFCGLGALLMAWAGSVKRYGIVDYTYSEWKSVRARLDSLVDGEEFHEWNDAPERTFPEVKSKFLEAIALAEAEEQGAAK